MEEEVVVVVAFLLSTVEMPAQTQGEIIGIGSRPVKMAMMAFDLCRRDQSGVLILVLFSLFLLHVLPGVVFRAMKSQL